MWLSLIAYISTCPLCWNLSHLIELLAMINQILDFEYWKPKHQLRCSYIHSYLTCTLKRGASNEILFLHASFLLYVNAVCCSLQPEWELEGLSLKEVYLFFSLDLAEIAQLKAGTCQITLKFATKINTLPDVKHVPKMSNKFKGIIW